MSLESPGCARFGLILKSPDLCCNEVLQIPRLLHRLTTGNSPENTDFLLGNSR